MKNVVMEMDVKIMHLLVIMVSEIYYSDFEQVESHNEEELTNDGPSLDSVFQSSYAVANNFYRRNRFNDFLN